MHNNSIEFSERAAIHCVGVGDAGILCSGCMQCATSNIQVDILRNDE